MSATNTGHEIVIVRRHGDHEEAHHGGVWKIAFADFMTAMMAFFLVMWLISASDKNRESIARYFNPLKLVDSTTRPKGLHDTKKEDSSIEQSKADTEIEAHESKKDKPNKGEKPPVHSESKLFEDPYGTLAEIARGASPESRQRDGKRNAEGAQGGETFRDPFAPAPATSTDPDAELEIAGSPPHVPAPAAVALKQVGSGPGAGPTGAVPRPPEPPVPQAASRGAGAQTASKGAGSQTAVGETAPAAVALLAQIARAAGPTKTAPALEVRQTAEGLLISLTDKADFAMFATGSAEPDRKLVLLMDKVAKVLATKPGRIVVRGHTDARPYRKGTYDNWRLSADRAQMAHYMLVRGGLDEKRIERIEGYADHQLKLPANPNAPQNRRIELLLRDQRA